MENPNPKIHFRDRTRNPDEYKNRPHFLNAILTGHLAKCNIIMAPSRLTDDLGAVTCVACKNKLAEKIKP